jgi:hypothetical protein
MSASFWLGGLIGAILFGTFIFLAERLAHNFVNFLFYGDSKDCQDLQLLCPVTPAEQRCHKVYGGDKP